MWSLKIRSGCKPSWHNPNQSQGHDNKDNSIDVETKDEGVSDKAQSREDQNELEEKLLENKNEKRIVSFDDNPNANDNSKEDDNIINCNNETPNTDEYEDNVEEQTQNMLWQMIKIM